MTTASRIDVASARAAVLAALDAMSSADPKGSKGLFRKRFVDDFNARKIGFEDASIYDVIGILSEPTLKRWLKARRENGADGLSPKYGNRAGDGLIDRDTALAEFLSGQIAARPHISAAMLIAGMRANFPDGRGLPSYRAVQRWVAKYRAEQASTLLAIADPDAYRSKFAVAAGSRSEGIVRPNQLWELDSTLGDVLLLDQETGKPRRFALVKCIDVATRRVKMLVARTSTSAAIAALLRRALIDWGVPERVKTDNGQDYTSRALDFIFESLEISRELCPPFTPEAKPHVERGFKTFLHSLVELLPGYIGHNVSDRKSIEARRAFSARLGESDRTIAVSLSADEFQSICDRWADDLYAHRVHSSLGRSPFAAAASYEGQLARINDERALDILLLPASGESATRVVGKKGVAIAAGNYSEAILGAMVGETVRVLTDPADLGHVYIFALDGGFICEAVNHIRRGISAAEIAARKKAVQRAVIAEKKAEVRSIMRRVKTDELANDILRKSAEDAGKIVAPQFRKPGAHSTPALTEAGKAARIGDFSPREDTPAEREAKAGVVARLSHAPDPRARTPYDRAVAIEFAMNSGESVSREDIEWLKIYRTTADYRSYKQFWEFRRQWQVQQSRKAIAAQSAAPVSSTPTPEE